MGTVLTTKSNPTDPFLQLRVLQHKRRRATSANDPTFDVLTAISLIIAIIHVDAVLLQRHLEPHPLRIEQQQLVGNVNLHEAGLLILRFLSRKTVQLLRADRVTFACQRC